MAISMYLSTTESKTQTKQTRTTETESWIQSTFWWLPDGRRLKNTNRESQNSQGDVKYSVGNGVAKELTCMTHGHEKRCGDCLREWGVLGGKGQKGRIRTTVIA